MLNCVIIDDEQFSINAIIEYINQIPNVNVISTFTDPQIAFETVVNQNGFELLFMDVNMPKMSGIELAKLLRTKTQKLIFTTSHSEYALDAFEAEADAYLLKPYSFSKFYATINRLFPAHKYNSNRPSFLEDHFLVKDKEEGLKIIKVKFDEVIAFESYHNYVKIYLDNKKIITAYLTNRDILELVQYHNEFQQFHRAFIISVNHIDYIDGSLIKMKNNLIVKIGEYYKDNFNAYLGGRLIKTTRKNKQ